MVARDINAATLAAISEPAGFYPVVMVYLDWPGGAVRAHSNMGAISWDSQTWNGVGNFGGISLPGDEFGMAAQEASVALYGLGDDLDDYLDVDPRGRDAVIYFGAVTERDGNTLVGDPFPVFTGTMNGLADPTEPAEDGGYTRGVVVPLSSGPSQRSRGTVYHSFEDQTRNYLGDTAGRLLINATAESRRLRWPE